MTVRSTAVVDDVVPRGADYDITDPLCETGSGTRRRIRAAHALIYGMAAPSLLLALLADGGPLAQRLATGVAALATALMAVVMLRGAARRTASCSRDSRLRR